MVQKYEYISPRIKQSIKSQEYFVSNKEMSAELL